MSAGTAIEQGASPTPPVDPDLRSVAKKPWTRRLLSTTAAWVLLIDIVLVVIFQTLSNNGAFLSLQDVQSLLLGGTEALLLGLGIALLLGGGVIDFSIGSNLVLSSVTGALAVQAVAGPFNAAGAYPNAALAIVVGFLTALITGALFGFVNGLIISRLQINPLIATLGTGGIGLGIALVVTNGGNVSGLPSEIQTNVGLNTVAYIPIPALIALLLAVIVYLTLRYSRFGMHALAMGSSRSAADRSGINTKATIVRLTVIAGTLAGLAGFVDIARFGSTTATGHTSDALNALTAAVIGGTLLEGGRVSIVGTVFGTALAVILQQGLIVIGVQSFFQQIAVGVVLIIAVSIDRFRTVRAKT